jgi:hypothetical protein
MKDDLTDARFHEWLKSIFDHPVTRPAWWGNLVPDAVEPDIDWDEDAPATTSKYVTRLFTNSRQLLRQYSDGQVNQGLWYLVNPACSNVMTDALDHSVPLPERLTCIHSILSLFQDCFAERCPGHTADESPSEGNPNGLACQMWWDVFPQPCCEAVDRAILDVMRDTLAMPSRGCRESALHGLGHWQMNYPTEVKQIIDEFLAATPDLGQSLRQYAREARNGVLL